MVKKKTKQRTIVELKIKESKKLPAKVFATRAVVEKLLVIMKKHVGENKRISRMDLFTMIYGVPEYEVEELKAWFMWEIIKKAMHYCRQRTKCQIVSQRFTYKGKRHKNGSIFYYWVACTYFDAKIYRINLEKNIKAMIKSIGKMEKSVKQKWYKEKWSVD